MERKPFNSVGNIPRLLVMVLRDLLCILPLISKGKSMVRVRKEYIEGSCQTLEVVPANGFEPLSQHYECEYGPLATPESIT